MSLDDPFQMQRELRYGAPVCDQILTGRYFTIGYSWYFRQAKWTLEIINRERRLIRDLPKTKRPDNFRADLRLPHRFRADIKVFKGSGYDRGHLVPSADQNFGMVVNSETFLLSNMSPQSPDLNRGLWADLEDAVRNLDSQEHVLETYVLTCPVFYFGEPVKTIGRAEGKLGIDLPVPHAFIKSVLTEDTKGALSLWTFEMKNEKLTGKLADYLVSTYDVEQIVGGRFWDRVSGTDLHSQKKSPRAMWKLKADAPPAEPPVPPEPTPPPGG